ncbi:MAG: hypothetical protein HC897_00560 [Thermoanaerobaculia bacterium]|nr:hypothetical protein [Thermoanaerobaculia bacterium]
MFADRFYTNPEVGQADRGDTRALALTLTTVREHLQKGEPLPREHARFMKETLSEIIQALDDFEGAIQCDSQESGNQQTTRTKSDNKSAYAALKRGIAKAFKISGDRGRPRATLIESINRDFAYLWFVENGETRDEAIKRTMKKLGLGKDSVNKLVKKHKLVAAEEIKAKYQFFIGNWATRLLRWGADRQRAIAKIAVTRNISEEATELAISTFHEHGLMALHAKTRRDEQQGALSVALVASDLGISEDRMGTLLQSQETHEREECRALDVVKYFQEGFDEETAIKLASENHGHSDTDLKAALVYCRSSAYEAHATWQRLFEGSGSILRILGVR